MKKLDDFNFNGKKALVRVDFNVPLNEQMQITDDTRIRAAIPTLQKIIQDGGSAVLMSHLGRPKNGPEDKFSLKHIVAHLSEKLGVAVKFGGDCIGEDAFHQSANLQAGEVLLLDNVRFYQEETKGDKAFAEKLSKHGNIYVNDAFGTAHRAHASTTVVAQFFDEKTAGYVMQAELDNAQTVLGNAQKPFTAIMGGAKISDKILIIERMLDLVDNLLIGGAMAYTFFKAQNGDVGNSLVEEDKLELAQNLLMKAQQKGVNLLLPADSIAAKEFKNDSESIIVDNKLIPDGYMGLDIGPTACEEFGHIIKHSKTILWNGPMGVFEMSNFAEGTISVAKSVVAATEKGGFSLIGGGDSAAAVNSLGFGDRVSYVSTGGGALLEYMEGKELPGVAALNG